MAKARKVRSYADKYLINIMTFTIALLIGVVLTWLAASWQGLSTTVARSVEIKGTDGLMGLYGESWTYPKNAKVIYSVTYDNQSSQDRFIFIKATQREKDPSDPANCEGVVCDPGAYTGSTYSEKKLVKAGAKEVFTIPVVEYTATPTHSVDLEAFKTIAD